MSHNVLAVYDVLAARMIKRKGVPSILTLSLRLQGGQNVAEVLRGNGLCHDLAKPEPEPPKQAA
jgi:hypothetical protein